MPNVLISAAGSPSFSDTTSGSGTYSLTGFGSGSYTVTPSKTGGQNGAITSYDAALVAQYAVGNIVLDGAQQIVADVSGVGGISSYDAALIGHYAVSMPVTGNAGAWLFGPPSRTYSSVTSSISGEDYAALLMGDVSGNWDTTMSRSARGPEKEASVSAPHVVTATDNEVVIPVNITGAADKGVISYEFDLRYDPAVIQPQANVADLAKSLSSDLSVVVNAQTPGLLKVAVYGPTPISGNGVLLNLRFNAVGAPGSVSPLTWERLMLNEGKPGVVTTDGQVDLVAAASASAEIGGRVLTTMGRGVPNTRVTLTDSAGHTRSVISNGFGSYRFGGVQPGQTYTVSVETRARAFTPLTVSVTGQTVSADLIAQP